MILTMSETRIGSVSHARPGEAVDLPSWLQQQASGRRGRPFGTESEAYTGGHVMHGSDDDPMSPCANA